MLLAQVGIVEEWDVRRRRGTSSTALEVIGGLFSLLISFKPFSNLPFCPATESQSQDALDRTPG
jgi:hypothetical protein